MDSVEIVFRDSGSLVFTMTCPGREPSGAPWLYCAPDASFSRNSSTGSTTRSALGSRPNSFGSCGFIRSMNFRYAARISSREWKCRFGSFWIEAASAFQSVKPSRFATAVVSLSMRATCSTPI